MAALKQLVAVMAASLVVATGGEAASEPVMARESSSDRERHEEINRQLEGTAKRMNSQLPRELNAETTFLEVIPGDMELISVYRLNRVTAVNADEERAERTRELITQQYCSNPRTRNLADKGVTGTYVYKGAEGKEVVRFSIPPDTCE